MPIVELDTTLFPADPGFLLLDIGSGFGDQAEHYGQHRRVVTIEPDEQLARHISRRSSPWQLSSCRASGNAVPLRSASVDGVTALEVLEHVDDPDGFLAEAFRVLKPNGALCVAVPTKYTEAIYRRLHPRYMSNATHVRIFKKKDLLQRIENQGFAVARVTPEHFEPALMWFLYAAMRTDADHTGLVLDHPWVARRVTRAVARLERTRGIRRAVAGARRHFGKSWYVYARRTAD